MPVGNPGVLGRAYLSHKFGSKFLTFENLRKNNQLLRCRWPNPHEVWNDKQTITISRLLEKLITEFITLRTAKPDHL